jgi:hypothetical protein
MLDAAIVQASLRVKVSEPSAAVAERGAHDLVNRLG